MDTTSARTQVQINFLFDTKIISAVGISPISTDCSKRKSERMLVGEFEKSWQTGFFDEVCEVSSVFTLI